MNFHIMSVSLHSNLWLRKNKYFGFCLRLVNWHMIQGVIKDKNLMEATFEYVGSLQQRKLLPYSSEIFSHRNFSTSTQKEIIIVLLVFSLLNLFLGDSASVNYCNTIRKIIHLLKSGHLGKTKAQSAILHRAALKNAV